ncbi:hypothetical protein ACFVY0_42495 [Streptomyces sp. NPDC058286]|uniref:hypothetical protein n=1 Tax=Streptomyces sp. NPDC058286 TaxID=3346422 RepID=UPI0036E6D405
MGTDPDTGDVYASVLKPISSPYTTKTLVFDEHGAASSPSPSPLRQDRLRLRRTDWHAEHVPFVLRRATLFWILTGIALTIRLSMAISPVHDPILLNFALPIAVAFCLLAAWSAQGSHLMPHDDISYAEAQQANYEAYIESQHHAVKSAAHKQAQAAQ